VIQVLDNEPVDFLEISGGTYETLGATLWDGLQTNPDKAASTAAREAYFLEFARRATEISALPLMLTGGFRTVPVMNQALNDGGLALIGVGRPLIVNPSAAQNWLSGDGLSENEQQMLHTAGIGWYYHAIRQLAGGYEPDFDIEQKQAARQTRATDAAQAEAWKTRRSGH
jgi:2,4-dienoyl-CoA reductase-like NADH-dependent reductase (Old Yellow Enzyme family)